MLYRAENGITNKSVSGNRGAYGFLSLLSRRAHLLTTSSEQAVYLSLSRKRQSSLTTLFLLSPQSHGLCGDPFKAV